MKSDVVVEDAKKEFKKLFKEEFEDPNEAFQEFLLSLISKKKLAKLLSKGKKSYYQNLRKFL